MCFSRQCFFGRQIEEAHKLLRERGCALDIVVEERDFHRAEDGSNIDAHAPSLKPLILDRDKCQFHVLRYHIPRKEYPLVAAAELVECPAEAIRDSYALLQIQATAFQYGTGSQK